MGSPPAGQVPKRLDRRAPAPARRIRSTQEMLAEDPRPGTAAIVGRTLLGLLALLLALGAIFLVAAALEPDTEPARAPWASPSAPEVTPAPLEAQ